MKNRVAYIETLVLGIFAFSLSVIVVLCLHLDLLNLAYRSGVWAERDTIIWYLVIVYGIALTVATVASVFMIRYRSITLCAKCVHWFQSVAQEGYATWKWLSSTANIKDVAVWLLPLLSVGIAVRFYFLAQPMRYDEAFTFLNFVNRGLAFLFYYPTPNNHVLHTLLARTSVAVFGGHPAAIRLPALLAGLCVIPLTIFLCRLLTRSSKSGFLASGLVTVFPYLILYDTMARGYSLLVLLSLSLAVLGYRLIDHPSMRLCFWVALLTALGLLNMPSFLFPAVGLLFWALVMLVQKGHNPVWILSRVLIPCSVMTIGLTGLFYTPTILASNGIHALVANRVVKGLPWSEFLDRLPGHISSTAIQFTRDIPYVIVICALLLFIGGLCSYAWKGLWRAMFIFPALVLGGAVVLVARHAIPFERTWIYLLPFIFILVDAGFVVIIQKAPGIYVRKLLLLLTGCSAVLLMSHGTIASYSDTGHFPEALVFVEALSSEMNTRDKVVVKVPADAPLHFYIWYRDIPRENRLSDPEIAPKTFFVVKPSSYSLTDLTNRDSRMLLKIGDAELHVGEMTENTGVLHRGSDVHR